MLGMSHKLLRLFLLNKWQVVAEEGAKELQGLIKWWMIKMNRMLEHLFSTNRIRLLVGLKTHHLLVFLEEEWGHSKLHNEELWLEMIHVILSLKDRRHLYVFLVSENHNQMIIGFQLNAITQQRKKKWLKRNMEDQFGNKDSNIHGVITWDTSFLLFGVPSCGQLLSVALWLKQGMSS
jgi:hypothetical protein